VSWLLNNFAVIAVAVSASLLAWLFGGTNGPLLLKVAPWIIALLVEVMICFPQRREDESTYDARERVWRAFRSDPLCWVAGALLVMLAFPFVNNGLCQNCDAAVIATGVSPEPPIPFLPFCVDRLAHLNVFLWFALALPMVVIVRHGLNRHGQRLLIELMVWNGAALSVLGFVQQAAGAPGPLWSVKSGLNSASVGDFFSSFGYPNMGGDYFVVLFGLALALWRDHFESTREELMARAADGSLNRKHKSFWNRNYHLIPAGVFFFSALATLSRAAILLACATAVIYFAHSLISLLKRMHRAQRFRLGTLSIGVLGIMIFFASVFAPKELRREVDTLDTTGVLDRVSGRGLYHSRVATEVWKDHLFFGCGGWGYPHHCIQKMTKEELRQIQMVGGINVHNDYLQFLAEHGLVGFGAMVALVLMLIWPIAVRWRRLAREARFVKGKDAPPRPVQIFALPASVFFMLTAAAATCIHAFGDCPLRSPAVLSLFLITLAAMPGFMHKKG